MHHLLQFGRGVHPLAWSQRLCGCGQALDAQASRVQANEGTNVCQISTNLSADFTQHAASASAESVDFLHVPSGKERWNDKVMKHSTRQPSQRALSTKVVDATVQATSLEKVQSLLSTVKLSGHPQVHSTSSSRALSTKSFSGCDHSLGNVQSTSSENTSINAKVVDVNQQLTDQPLNSSYKSTESTETPQSRQESASTGGKSGSGTPKPPDPETCCESGCVNCVWIRYVQELQEHAPNDKEQIKKVLDLIEDYNVKMFVKMEMGL